MHEFHPKRRTRPCVYYQQGKCNRVNCNFSHDVPVVGTTGHAPGGDVVSPSDASVPRLPRFTPENMVPPPSHPRPSVIRTKPCRFYAKGRCTAGDACRWSHDDTALYEEEDLNPSENGEFVPTGFKLVHKSYRTLPCARFQKGHCIYGEQCTFIHSTPSPRLQLLQNENPYASSAPTPNARATRDLGYFGSPASLIMNLKSHSQHHSPASALGTLPALGRSMTHSPALVNTVLSRASAAGNVPGSPSLAGNPNISLLTQSPSMMSRSNSLIAHTPPIPTSASLPSLGSRELPPPSAQSRLSGANWGLPTAKPTVLTSSPSLLAADWSHPSPIANANPSPFLLTFGEIGPNGVSGGSGYASPAPRVSGLGGNPSGPAVMPGSPKLNGDSLSALNGNLSNGMGSSQPNGGLQTATNSEATVNAASAPQPPSLVFGSTANINTTYQSLSSNENHSSEDIPRRSRLPSFADTEPDFPSIINYSDMGDYLGDVEDVDDDPSINDPYKHTIDLGGFHDSTVGISALAPATDYDGVAGSWPGPPADYADYVQPYPDDQSWRLSYKTRRCKYYVAGSRCPAGTSCTFIHDPEALKRPVENPPPPPLQNPIEHPLYRTRECKYHLAGRCHQENDCAFKHTGPPGQGREYENWEGVTMNVKDYDVVRDDANYRTRPCKWFLKGNCFHGDNCTYVHDAEYFRPACIFWKNGMGHCMNGDNCRFSHDIVDDHTSASGENGQQRSQEGTDYIPTAASGQQELSVELDASHQPLTNGHSGLQSSFVVSETQTAQVPVLTHTFHEDDDVLDDDFIEPYMGPSLGGLVDARAAQLNGTGGLGRLMVDERAKMELVVSEGEEEESDEDIIVMRPSNGSPSPLLDKSESSAIEGLFSSMTISTAISPA